MIVKWTETTVAAPKRSKVQFLAQGDIRNPPDQNDVIAAGMNDFGLAFDYGQGIGDGGRPFSLSARVIGEFVFAAAGEDIEINLERPLGY